MSYKLDKNLIPFLEEKEGVLTARLSISDETKGVIILKNGVSVTINPKDLGKKKKDIGDAISASLTFSAEGDLLELTVTDKRAMPTTVRKQSSQPVRERNR